MIKQLSDFTVGQRGKIVKVNGDGAIRRRLFDMGVTPGADVMLRKKALLGLPTEVNLRGSDPTPRRGEAACVEVEL